MKNTLNFRHHLACLAAAAVMAGCGGGSSGDEAQHVDDYPTTVTLADGTKLSIDSQTYLTPASGIGSGPRCKPNYFVLVKVRASASPFPLEVDLSGAEVWKDDRRVAEVEYAGQATQVPDEPAIETSEAVCQPSSLKPGDQVLVAAEVGVPGVGRVHLKGAVSLVAYVD